MRSFLAGQSARARSWLRAIAQRRRLEADMDAELADHLERLTADLIEMGYSPAEGARRARVAIGPALVNKEGMRASLGLRWCDELGADLRYAARILLKSPAFTAVAVVSLGLGIGANTAVFTAAKKVLLDALPVKNPQELRLLTWVSGPKQVVPPVWGDVRSTESGLVSPAFSYPVMEELRKKTDVFRDLIAFKDVGEITATVNGHAQTATAELLSGNAFMALGVATVLGRALTPADDQPAAGPVAVISEQLWTERFGRSKSVIGNEIALNGIPVAIVGVSPKSFAGLTLGEPAQIYLPIALQPLLIPRAQITASNDPSLLQNPQSWWVSILIRLRRDVPETRAQAALDVVLRTAAVTSLSNNGDLSSFHLKLEPGNRGDDSLRGFAMPSYVLLGLTGLVLLLACVNVATLLLARGAVRLPEIATRIALGAGKKRILRQLLTENLLLTMLGGAFGLVFGYLGRNLIPQLVQRPSQIEDLRGQFDGGVLAFTCGTALLTGILFGVAPAWRTASTNAALAIKRGRDTTAGVRRALAGRVLVAAQLALSTMLLIGAALFVRTVITLGHRQLGFQADHLLLFQLNPPRARYTDSQMLRFYVQLQDQLAAIPGVRSASLSNIAIIGDGHSGSTFHVLGRPLEQNAPRVQTNSIGADFFPTMGIPILQGRNFNAHDTATSPRVALINRALAQRYFPHEDPVGKLFQAEAGDVNEPTQIVGVVADTQYADLRSQTPPTFYLPFQQRSIAGRMVVELRTVGDPGSVLNEARRMVESLDRDLPLMNVRTMTEQVRSTFATERMFAQLTCGFGLLAVTLACVGIYGLLSYTTSQRRKEIGIRMALGAQRSQVRTLVLRDGISLAAAGSIAGGIAALFLARLIRSLLYGVATYDPATFAVAFVLLLAVAIGASWIPARRAAHVQPMDALRHE